MRRDLGEPDLNNQYPFDPDEPPFTEDELATAYEIMRRVTPCPRQPRRDQCPHAVQCATPEECIENVAWYLRHQAEIEHL